MPLATGCFNFGIGSDKGKYKTEELAAAWLWATGGSKEEVTPYTTTTDPETVSTGGAVTTYKTGTRFYNGIVNDSTDLITNESGDAIAQYAYEPFGRIVPEASDLDLDGDGKSYTGGFLYTGQEWELETDVYNFHARTYDAQTGRFMQNDPVFADRAGFDSYDTYGYAYNSPANFTDPTGMVSVWAALAGGYKLAAKAGSWKNFTGNNALLGLKWAARSGTGGFRWAGKGIGDSFRSGGEASETLRGNRHNDHSHLFNRTVHGAFNIIGYTIIAIGVAGVLGGLGVPAPVAAGIGAGIIAAGSAYEIYKIEQGVNPTINFFGLQILLWAINQNRDQSFE